MTDAQNLKPHRGALILILGISSLFCCFIFTGVPAVIMGSKDLVAMDAGMMDPAGKGITKAGKICGIIGCALFFVSLVVRGIQDVTA